MKALLHFRTDLGPRTIVAEIGDYETARAVVNAHLASGEQASLCDEMPRLSMKDHLARHNRAKAKAALRVITADPKVTSIRKAKVRT